MTEAELQAIRKRMDHDWFNCFRSDTPPDIDDAGEDVKRDVTALLAEVERLRTELDNFHCESCDGSAPECRAIPTVPRSKQI